MKKLLIIITALILLVSTAIIASSAASVIISPSAPTNGDDLTCYVSGVTADMDIYWLKNGQEFRVDYGTQSTISNALTNPGDKWKCVVYKPYGDRIGEDEVRIPSSNLGNVLINPAEPEDSNDLTCSVSGSSAAHNFEWSMNGISFRQDNNVMDSVISASDTNPGDSWRCIVIGEGESTVQIDTDSNGTLSISPESPRTYDDLTADVADVNGNLEYTWQKNGNQFITETAESSVISSSDTTKGDVWKVEVYTPLYHRYVGEDSATIMNAAPTITSVNVPLDMNAGSTYTLSFTASDADGDSFDYSISIDGKTVSDSNSYVWKAKSGEHQIVLAAYDSEDTTELAVDVDVSSGRIGRTVRMNDLDISPIFSADSQYIEISNKVHSVKGAAITIVSVDTNEIMSYNMDIPRNSIKLLPVSFNITDDNIYLIRVDISSSDVDGSAYMLVET
jgi:hypothetical protein